MALSDIREWLGMLGGVLTPITLAGLFLLRRSFASVDVVVALERRVAIVEQAVSNMPTAAAMEQLRGEMRQLGERIEGVKDLLERAEDAIRRHDGILAEAR